MKLKRSFGHGCRSVPGRRTATLPADGAIRMNETRLHSCLRIVCKDLSDSRAAYALVGGLAVSARTEPRFTKDLDLVVAAAGDREAEALIAFFRSRQYRIEALVEQEATARLSTVRLEPPTEFSLFVDLLFASSGIEAEIVAAADSLEIIEGLVVRVATIGHLIATKRSYGFDRSSARSQCKRSKLPRARPCRRSTIEASTGVRIFWRSSRACCVHEGVRGHSP